MFRLLAHLVDDVERHRPGHPLSRVDQCIDQHSFAPLSVPFLDVKQGCNEDWIGTSESATLQRFGRL